MSITPALPGNPDPNLPVPDVTAIKGVSARFQINNAKLYVPVVTLSFNDNIGFLEKIKQRFKRRIYWNKYRSEITAQPKSNNLDYLIDPTFRNINRLLSFKNGNGDPTWNSFGKYSMPLLEMKDFNSICPRIFLSDHAQGKAYSTPSSCINPNREMLLTWNLAQSYFVTLQKKW